MRWLRSFLGGRAQQAVVPVGAQDGLVDAPPEPKPSSPEEVGDFYDRNNDAFLEVYGEVIQAFRTRQVERLLDYQIESIGFLPGQRALDAGCGVCGPALYFARKADVHVQGITVSAVQVAHAQARIAEAGLGDQVSVRRASYQALEHEFAEDSFDIVYFLESFGHSDDICRTLDGAWKVLKPGGALYIKDLFRKVPAIPEHVPRIDAEIRKINSAYCYNIPDLAAFLDALRRRGFILQFLKTIDLPLEDFENLTISNEFQELTGIGRIENWKDYVFPVDFFEVRCIKPVHDIRHGNSRYFLQNLYHLSVLQTRPEDL